MPQHAGNIPYMPLGMKAPAELRRWMGSATYKQFNDRVNAMLKNQASTLGNVARFNGKVYRLGASANAARMFSNGGLEALDPTMVDAYQNQMNKFKAKATSRTLTPEYRRNLRQGRQFASLIGGQLLGGAGDIATAMGYTGLGNILGNIGSGVTSGAGAAMGLSLAGIGGRAAGGIGIAVGLATAITKNISSMEQLAVAVNKAAKAFDENYAVIHRQTKGIQDSIMNSRHQTRANQLLESENIDEAKKQAKYWSDAYESAKSTFENINDPLQEERRIRNLAEQKKSAVDAALQGTNLEWAESTLGETLFKIMGQEGAATRKQEVKNQIDEEAQRQIQEMQQRYKDLQQEMNQAKGRAEGYQNVVDQIEKKRKDEMAKSDAEVQKRLALNERNEQTIARFKAEGAVNRTQMFANEVLGDKMLSPLEKFGKIADQLDALRSQRASTMSEAFGISKEIQEGKMNSEDMARAMAKQARLEFDANSLQNQIGVLENMLGNI